jgi:hypothetical protein
MPPKARLMEGVAREWFYQLNEIVNALPRTIARHPVAHWWRVVICEPN